MVVVLDFVGDDQGKLKHPYNYLDLIKSATRTILTSSETPYDFAEPKVASSIIQLNRVSFSPFSYQTCAMLMILVLE